MRIKIGDKVYDPVARDEVSLRDLMLFNTQAREFGINWGDVQKAMAEFDELSEAEAAVHPQQFLIIGVTIWMARRAAGEGVTFSEAVDVNLADVDFLPDPEDHKPAGKAKAAKKKAPKASALVAAPDPNENETSAPQPSEKRSIPA